jgi:hypothetical protein
LPNNLITAPRRFFGRIAFLSFPLAHGSPMDEKKRELSKRYWSKKVRVSKLEAARRQLDCAIQLWFLDGDEVSIHTLAAAAHQIIHDIKAHHREKRELLYDTSRVKPEHRKEWIRLLKESANFFKHADSDSDPATQIQFSPFGNLMFIVFSIMGLGMVGAATSYQMNALIVWLSIHEPNLISGEFIKRLTEASGIEDFEDIERLPKHEFFQAYMTISAATA